MAPLLDYLSELRNPDLAWRAKMLQPGLKATAKLPMTQAITGTLLGPQLRAVWQSLSDLEKLAVAEALHSPRLMYHPAQFKAKHGQAAAFYIRDANSERYSYSYDNGPPTKLGLFLYGERGGGYSMPTDLASRLMEWVPKPKEKQINTLAEPPQEAGSYLRESEKEALNEVLDFLRLADVGGLVFSEATGLPSAATTQAMHKMLPYGDWFPLEIALEKPAYSGASVVGFIKPTAWTCLLKAGGLIKMNGKKSALTEAGRRLCKQPAWEIIRHLWQSWIANTDYDEFNRIDLIKGQNGRGVLTARQPRRECVTNSLRNCPVGKWITLQELSRHMLAQGLNFEISREDDSLYIGDKRYGSLGYDGGCEWGVIPIRYMACILMEYAATLGLVDICYLKPEESSLPSPEWIDVLWISRYDGLLAFRITPLGRYCMNKEATDYRPAAPSVTVNLECLPDLSIRLKSGSLSPADIIQIESWAEPISDNVWKADSARAIASVEAGRDAAEFRTYLQERDDQPLPEKMEAFLKNVVRDGHALRTDGEALLFQCRDEETAALIATRLPQLCLRAGERTIVVPTGKIDTFRKRVRSFGLGIQ